MTTRGLWIAPAIIGVIVCLVMYICVSDFSFIKEEQTDGDIVSVTITEDNAIIVKYENRTRYYIPKCEYGVWNDSLAYTDGRFCTLINPLPDAMREAMDMTDKKDFDISVYSQAVNDTLNSKIYDYGFTADFRLFETNKAEVSKNMLSIHK